MHELYKLKEMLCKELEEYGSKGELSGGTLEVVDKLAHAVKNLDKIIQSKEEDEGSYAEGDRSFGRMTYAGNSYARGRGRYAKRDSMGRYSSRTGYSREGNSDQYVEQLEEMMQEVPESAQRHIQKAIQEMQM